MDQDTRVRQVGEARLETEHERNHLFRCDRSGHDEHSFPGVRPLWPQNYAYEFHEQGDSRPGRGKHDGPDAEVVTHG